MWIWLRYGRIDVIKVRRESGNSFRALPKGRWFHILFLYALLVNELWLCQCCQYCQYLVAPHVSPNPQDIWGAERRVVYQKSDDHAFSI